MMKRTISGLCIVALLAVGLVSTGCSMGSGATFGPASVQSRVGVHEWRPAKFYCDPEETGCTGSTFGFFSSEICGKLHECNGMGLDLWIDWDQDGDPWEYPVEEDPVDQ